MQVKDMVKAMEEKYGMPMNEIAETVLISELEVEELTVLQQMIITQHAEVIRPLNGRVSEIERVLTCQDYDQGGAGAYV